MELICIKKSIKGSIFISNLIIEKEIKNTLIKLLNNKNIIKKINLKKNNTNIYIKIFINKNELKIVNDIKSYLEKIKKNITKELIKKFEIVTNNIEIIIK